MEILPRHPPHKNVLDIPTPPHQQLALFLIFFFTALAFVIFVLRVVSRLKTRQWGWDDYAITAAMASSLVMIGPMYMHIKLMYYGWRVQDVPQPHDVLPAFWWFHIGQIFYNPILALVKASVLLFLLRLGGQKPGVRIAIHSLNVFNALLGIGIFFVDIFECVPLEANWDFALKADPNTHCIDNSFHIAAASITIFTDILVIALPFWIFLGLNMPKAAKVAVLGIFGIGVIVLIMSIARLVSLVKLFYVIEPNEDPYYDIGITLNIIEANLAIVSACCPALRPLFRRLFGSGSYTNGASGSNKNGFKSGDNTVITIGGSHLPGTGGHSGTGSKTHKSNHGGSRPDTSRSDGTTTHYGPESIHLKAMRHKAGHTEIRSASPSGSEEQIMTYNGIVRTQDFKLHYDGQSGHSASIHDLEDGRGTKERY